MGKTVYLTSAYLAPVEYYTKLFAYPCACIEQYDHYVKQTYRNRCVIATADGPLALTIPTEKDADASKCLMKDIRISDHGNWRHVHWNALVAAYRHSPFFEYYADDFRPFYEKKIPFLWDFNQELCALVCRLIDLAPCILPTETYLAELPEGADDFRERIHPKRDYRQTDPGFRPFPYYQVFKDRLGPADRQGFLPNLSIADLLFNMGPESLLVLRDSITSL